MESKAGPALAWTVTIYYRRTWLLMESAFWLGLTVFGFWFAEQCHGVYPGSSVPYIAAVAASWPGLEALGCLWWLLGKRPLIAADETTLQIANVRRKLSAPERTPWREVLRIERYDERVGERTTMQSTVRYLNFAVAMPTNGHSPRVQESHLPRPAPEIVAELRAHSGARHVAHVDPKIYESHWSDALAEWVIPLLIAGLVGVGAYLYHLFLRR